MKANEPTNEIKNEEKAEEPKGEKVPETFDIKDMANLLVDKTTIGTPLLAQIDKFNFNKYNLINPPLTAKRILNSSTVRYFCQSYFYDQKNKKFEIFDRNYKNIKKDKLSNMSQDKKWIRYCLLLMSEGEQTLFEIQKDILEEYYKDQVKKFFERKKKDKEKELKEIEREKIKEKIQKEKEELKKKGELEEGVVPSQNPPPPKQKQELKIDMKIVEDVPNQYQLEEKIYYRIYIEDVYIEKPPFPSKAKDLDTYVKAFNAEIKRLLQKEEKKNKEKREYNIAESWCNELIAKVINMGKGKLKDEYESEKFKSKRKEVEEEMKKPILNLMYIYSKKMENNSTIIRQAITLVENTYYKRFKGQYDESFLKITGRYVNCLIKVNDFSKAKKVIEVIKKKCSKLKDTENLLKDLEPKLEEAEKKKNNENITISKGQIKAGQDDTKPNYDWHQGQNEDELNDALNKDVNQVKSNMNLINSNM
jgi:hypothetical protein